uniref:Uncharacterized protein n=1 Tax=Cannabis sativa TaxID=3483 RepID=A0A803QCD0_CANSA
MVLYRAVELRYCGILIGLFYLLDDRQFLTSCIFLVVSEIPPLAEKKDEVEKYESQANLTEELPFTAMISEINIIGGSERWWVAIDASCHICYDRTMFKT